MSQSWPGDGFETRRLAGWGRFPVECCHVFRPPGQAELAELLTSGLQPSYIAHGLGRSYGDAALNRERGVVCLAGLNRFLSFDASTPVLECEAGVSFADILRHFLPRGFFPPVTPGTKFVTVGGAIASDIHGKNHHRDGTLSAFILDFRLLTASGECLTCSPTANSEIFWATLGGMGLTGFVLSARVRLRRVESAQVLVDYQKVRNLDEAAGLMLESDDRYQYSVAWMDCLAKGSSLGRAVLMRGHHAAAADLPARVSDPLSLATGTRLRIPFDFPSLSLNRYTVGAFNALFYGWHSTSTQRLVDLEKFFYPLDAIEGWNRMYGKRGFVQYQVALPLETSGEGLKVLLERLVRSRRPSFLAVLKRFGDSNAGPLSFPLKGFTLALDLPMVEGLVPFLHELNAVVRDYGGRVYLAKDAVLNAEEFAGMYPKLEGFRNIKERLDPKGLLSSSLARRVGIVRG
jgi:decaprenylphospho-beta-D-ribofuranose 2-oxidase